MKKLFLKSFAVIVIGLFTAVNVFAASGVDWASLNYIGNGADVQYTNKYKIQIVEGLDVVNIQKPGFAVEAGIYCTVPAGIASLSVSGAIQGAGAVLYMSSFTAQETEVTITYDGTKTITFWVYYEDGTTEPADVEGVSLDKTEAQLPLNKTLTLKATVAPANASNKVVSWTSSNTDVATVADGVVTPVAKGTTTITVTTEEGSFTATCAVTVIDAAVDKPTAAPTIPTHPANQVKAIYSETYNADCDFQDWGSATQYTQDTYGKKFVTVDRGYLGLTFAELNCATMETLHADVWVADDCSMRFVPILHLPDNTANYPDQGVTVNLEGGKWNSIDIALNEGDWANYKDWMKVYQLKIDNVPNRTFWVNNIYFYTTAEEDTTKPVMGEASLASVTHNSAVINVEGTDKKTAYGEDVPVSLFQVVYGETTNVFAAVDGKITITGLAQNTTYTFVISAQDNADNISDNSVTVTATTEKMIYCDFPTGHQNNANFGDVEGRILVTISNPTGNVVRVTVQPNKENGATKNLVWLQVNAPGSVKEDHIYVAGTHQATETEAKESLSVDVEYATIPENIGKLELKWAYPAWDGMWVASINNIQPASFCDKNTPSVIPVVESDTKAVKVLRDGQLVILRDGVEYNVLGAQIR